MKEVIFIEGVNKTGKDYFLDNCQKYFPASSIYYAPKENLSHQYDSCFITYNTIFSSIIKDTSIYPAFVYRSPITELVYNEFFRREKDLNGEVKVINLLEKFLSTFKCTFIYLENSYTILKERGFKYAIEDFYFLKDLYERFFLQLKIEPVLETSIDVLYNRLDNYVKELNNLVLVDVDETHYLSNGKIWNPQEVVTHYISGVEHDEFSNILYSPFQDIFLSSFNFKYALIKKLCEREKKFIFYDNYLTLLSKAAMDFKLNYSIINVEGDSIGRLDNSNL